MHSRPMIDDNALYPGAFVRKLLRQGAADGEVVRWLELTDAALLLRRRPDTLRKQCLRWFTMEDPVIRVRKKSDLTGSHWLLCESDVYALVRGPVTQEEGAQQPVPPPAVDNEEATVALWVEQATRHI